MAKLIDLSKERYDVAPLTRTNRIIFYAETKECLVYSDNNNAKKKWERDGRVGIIISPDKAAKTIPEFFFNSAKAKSEDRTHSILLNVSQELYDFLESKGNKSEYIRHLIRRAMSADL